VAIVEEPNDMPDEWTEVNIVQPADPVTLLTDVIDPLVHSELNGYIDNWHYFWENDPIGQPHLRLRIRWLDPAKTEGYQKLSGALDRERNNNRFSRWFTGDNGVEGQVYPGEDQLYGPEVWVLTYKDWTSGSELALAIMKFFSQQRLTQPRDFHWERRAHLYSDQMLLPETLLCLRQAYLYRRQPDMANPEIVDILQRIKQLLNLP
jgi:hypothetical protein